MADEFDGKSAREYFLARGVWGAESPLDVVNGLDARLRSFNARRVVPSLLGWLARVCRDAEDLELLGWDVDPIVAATGGVFPVIALNITYDRARMTPAELPPIEQEFGFVVYASHEAADVPAAFGSWRDLIPAADFGVRMPGTDAVVIDHELLIDKLWPTFAETPSRFRGRALSHGDVITRALSEGIAVAKVRALDEAARLRLIDATADIARLYVEVCARIIRSGPDAKITDAAVALNDAWSTYGELSDLMHREPRPDLVALTELWRTLVYASRPMTVSGSGWSPWLAFSEHLADRDRVSAMLPMQIAAVWVAEAALVGDWTGTPSPITWLGRHSNQ